MRLSYKYISFERNVVILGLQAGTLAMLYSFLQVTIMSNSTYALFALIGVFLGALIQTITISYSFLIRAKANIILAFCAGGTTIIGSYFSSSLYLMLLGILIFVPLVAFSSSNKSVFAALVLFTVDLFIVSSGAATSSIHQAIYYGVSFFIGCTSLAIMSYIFRSFIDESKVIKHYDYKKLNLIAHAKQNIYFAFILTVAVLVATCIWFWFSIPEGFWVPMTVLLTLKSDHDFTRSRLSHRLYGTLLGSILAIIIGFSITSKIFLAIIMLPLIFFIVASMARHYGAYTLVLTIMVTVMVNLTHSLGYHIAEHRLMDTLIAVVTVMVVILLLRPRLHKWKFLK